MQCPTEHGRYGSVADRLHRSGMWAPELDDKKRGGAFRKRISHAARSNLCIPFASHLATGHACLPFLDPHVISCHTSRAARNRDCQASGRTAQWCGRGKKRRRKIPHSQTSAKGTPKEPRPLCSLYRVQLPTSGQVKQSQANQGAVSECPTIWPK